MNRFKVKRAALSADASLKVLPCGSFRRGKQTCGDIDVLIIKKDYIKHDAVLPKIINNLKLISRFYHFKNPTIVQ